MDEILIMSWRAGDSAHQIAAHMGVSRREIFNRIGTLRRGQRDLLDALRVLRNAPATGDAAHAGHHPEGRLMRGREVIRRVAAIAGVPVAELLGRSRRREVVRARQVAMWLIATGLG